MRGELWEHLGVFSIIAIACLLILFGASFHAVRIANNEQRALRDWQAEIEQRQRVEIQMRQAFKMEALGRMADGIAHHFNNLLPAMSGLLEQTLSEVPPNSPTARRVQRMMDAVAQGRQLVHQILVFGRHEIPGPDRLSMGSIAEGALALVQGSLPPNIAVATDCRPGGDVPGDRAQLQDLRCSGPDASTVMPYRASPRRNSADSDACPSRASGFVFRRYLASDVYRRKVGKAAKRP